MPRPPEKDGPVSAVEGKGDAIIPRLSPGRLGGLLLRLLLLADVVALVERGEVVARAVGAESRAVPCGEMKGTRIPLDARGRAQCPVAPT